jgi:hypothetical protein
MSLIPLVDLLPVGHLAYPYHAVQYEFVVRDGFAAVRQADERGDIDILARTDKVGLPRGKPSPLRASASMTPRGVRATRRPST